MQKVTLGMLKFDNRKDALAFLQRLWSETPTPCPFCGQTLEPLHKKAKKDDSDWQCRSCDKVFRAMDLFMDLNREMPK